MSDAVTGTHKAVAGGVIVAVCAAVLTLGLLLREHAPGGVGNGFLAGGAVALVAAAVAFGRVLLRPDRATVLERAWTQTGDERDDLLLTRALAVLGISSLPMTGVAAMAVALGTPPEMAFAVLLFVMIGVFAAAFAVVSRRS